MIVAWVAVWGLTPPHALVLLGPQQHVDSINLKIGVHTRLTEEVEEWKIKKSLELVREMGASWIVEYFPWVYYEPRKGQYDWTHADLVVRHARRQGLTVIARIGYTPGWARPEGSFVSYLSPEHYADLGDFVYAFVDHYRGQIDHVIIWNEPNLAFEWGYRPPDPAEYAQMLRIASARAKEANPAITILGGALAPTLGAPDAVNDLSYLQGLYDAGAGPYFDALAVHAYGWTAPPGEDAAPGTINFRRVELLREIMVRNGDGDKPVMITEGGWNDDTYWAHSVTPRQRVAYTLQAYELARQAWPWCDAAVLWIFRFPAPEGSYLDHYTFVTPDFVLKPVYEQVKRYAHGQDVSEWME